MIKKIPARHLMLGMFVCGNDRNWLDTPFFRSKFLITSTKQIKELQEYCTTIYIDTKKGLDAIPVPKPSDNPASRLYFNCLAKLAALPPEPAPDKQAILPILQELLAGLLPHGEALLALSLMTENLRNSNTFPVNLCIQSLLLGQRIGITDTRLSALAAGATLYGLQCSRQLAAGHELLSPFVSPNDDQSLAAIVALVSAFNIQSLRLADQAAPGIAALQYLQNNAPSQFNTDLLARFIETIGLYPPGCVVELNTGELALVTDSAPDSQTLLLLSKTNKQLLESTPEIKLNDASNRRIAGVLAADDPVLTVLALHKVQLDQ